MLAWVQSSCLKGGNTIWRWNGHHVLDYVYVEYLTSSNISSLIYGDVAQLFCSIVNTAAQF